MGQITDPLEREVNPRPAILALHRDHQGEVEFNCSLRVCIGHRGPEHGRISRLQSEPASIIGWSAAANGCSARGELLLADRNTAKPSSPRARTGWWLALPALQHRARNRHRTAGSI